MEKNQIGKHRHKTLFLFKNKPSPSLVYIFFLCLGKRTPFWSSVIILSIKGQTKSHFHCPIKESFSSISFLTLSRKVVPPSILGMIHYPNRGLYVMHLVSAGTEILKSQKENWKVLTFPLLPFKGFWSLTSGVKAWPLKYSVLRAVVAVQLSFFPLKCKHEEAETRVLDRETSKWTWNFIGTIWSAKRFPFDRGNGTLGREPNGALCAHLLSKGDLIQLLCM